MPADPILYCLEQNTDYAAFETMCVDLMASAGFTGIEPIGGVGDRGRDAIWSGRDSDSLVVFAFSCREDWERKLYDDCERIQECEHQAAKLVFVSSRPAQSQARDRAKQRVQDRFGWTLDLYDVRRVRAMLKGAQRSVLANHRSIFGPPWFDTRGGLLIDDLRDTLIVDHLQCDHAFATWLSGRLQLVGYKVWCRGMAPLVGEDAHDTIGQLIATRALRYLPILSAESVRHGRDLLDRCAHATSTGGLVTLPCVATAVDEDLLGEQLRRTKHARFDRSWSKGLNELLQTLEATGVRPTAAPVATHHVSSLYSQRLVIVKDEPEAIYANVFRATVPQAIAAFQLSEDVTDDKFESARRTWAFGKGHERVILAFQTPPEDVCLPLLDNAPARRYAWRSFRDEHGRKSIGLIKELVRRTLEVACGRAGLEWCEERKEYYVPQTETSRYEFRHVDRERRTVGLAGHRSYGSGADKKLLWYQLVPRFRVHVDDDQEVWVALRIYIRLVGENGILVPSTSVARMRKKVTKGWWNKQWLVRTLAMMQRISKGETAIEVGEGSERVSVTTTPLRLECPLSIDAQAMETLADFQDEFATIREEREDDADDLYDMDGGTDDP